jgi:regulator of sigma E protease
VGVRVEQFAVGIGHAICSFRKGIGFRIGNTRKEYDARTGAILKERNIEPKGPDGAFTEYQRGEIAKELGIGETEYRLSWIPIGGYVKPTGQEDIRTETDPPPDDPYSYPAKSISARMLIISAGVIMNIILAAILFTVVFRMGFRTAPAVVGHVQPNSPAQVAGFQVGDRIKSFDGDAQHDYKSLTLAIALARPGESVPVTIERDGRKKDLNVLPRKPGVPGEDFLAVGIIPSHILRGLDPKLFGIDPSEQKLLDRAKMILPGDVITAINGSAVKETDYPLLDQAVQNFNTEKPLELTVKDKAGNIHAVHPKVTFASFFGTDVFNIAGLQPRPKLASVDDKSPLKGKLFKDDVIVSISAGGEIISDLTQEAFVARIREFGKAEKKVDFVVERDGKRIKQVGAVPTFRTGPRMRGFGIGMAYDEDHLVVGNVVKDSPAEKAGIAPETLILEVNAKPVKNWLELHHALKLAIQSGAANPVLTTVRIDPSTGKRIDSTLRKDVTLAMAPVDRNALASVRLVAALVLEELIEPRKTTSPVEACSWGIDETKNMTLQFYITLHRLATGSVSPSNLMGPIGIVQAGSKFADKGNDWLIWFLAMISANLAVVNFLPIPIMDGGQFVFLMLEKIRGKPLSPKSQTATTIIGLTFILSLFAFVTYHDIVRIWF